MTHKGMEQQQPQNKGGGEPGFQHETHKSEVFLQHEYFSDTSCDLHFNGRVDSGMKFHTFSTHHIADG